MKIARIIAGFLVVFGVVLIIGAVGTCDCMVQLGEYYPFTQTLKDIGVGVLMMIPYWIIRIIDDTFEIHIRIYRKD